MSLAPTPLPRRAPASPAACLPLHPCRQAGCPAWPPGWRAAGGYPCPFLLLLFLILLVLLLSSSRYSLSLSSSHRQRGRPSPARHRTRLGCTRTNLWSRLVSMLLVMTRLAVDTDRQHVLTNASEVEDKNWRPTRDVTRSPSWQCCRESPNWGMSARRGEVRFL